MNSCIILICKLISIISKNLNLGNGSTWPGHIALKINKNFIKELIDSNRQLKVIIIAGTNGKTTTSSLIANIISDNGSKVLQNMSGANLLNGIASTLLLNSNINGEISAKFAIFEIDENYLSIILQFIIPHQLIFLNLFRDQLDRYGEVNSIAKKWSTTLENISSNTKIILNADDPRIAWLGMSIFIKNHAINDKSEKKIFYFGLDNPKLSIDLLQHASDSTYCPRCETKLNYKTIYYSHIGNWNCSKCNLKRPDLDTSTSLIYPLNGIYNQYNTNAAVLSAKILGIESKKINSTLKKFKPAFGRQEVIIIEGKKIQLFLSKNPTSMNQSLSTIRDLGGKHILFVLNNQIPDGRDISWIWDVDFEIYLNDSMNIYTSGDRCYDMSLRLKYLQPNIGNIITNKNIKNTIKILLNKIPDNEIIYILPTYSAMLEVRKILTGKKIL